MLYQGEQGNKQKPNHKVCMEAGMQVPINAGQGAAQAQDPCAWRAVQVDKMHAWCPRT
jgi:hypothetical protein